MKIQTFVLAAALGLSAIQVHAAHGGASYLAQAETARGEGEVRKIDKAAGKVTIKHGPLDGINMPAMTMVFRPKEAAMLDSLKEGDQVKFTTSRQGGAFTLDSVELKK